MADNERLEDAGTARLLAAIDAAHAAGLDSVCLTCLQGFNGPVCPRCWHNEPLICEAYARLHATVNGRDIALAFYGWLTMLLGAEKDSISRRAQRLHSTRLALDDLLTHWDNTL